MRRLYNKLFSNLEQIRNKSALAGSHHSWVAWGSGEEELYPVFLATKDREQQVGFEPRAA